MSSFLLRLMTLVIFILLFNQSALALTITSPKENQIVNAGDHIDVIVKPDAGEKWDKVLLAIFPMSYSFLSGEYKETIEIPQDALGVITITVLAVDNTGREVELHRNVLSKLPPNVALQSILVNKDYMLLYKLPAGSPAEVMQRIESRQLTVKGIYSDGVKRNITVSASGTTYASSNEQIVTVSPEGKVTAQGLGKAKITVRNGKYNAQVDVDVKPYRQPQQ